MKRARATPIPAHMLAPGYFLALVRRHDWPPGFAAGLDARPAEQRVTSHSIAERERQTNEAVGWANGTVLMAGTPKHPRPEWMGRAQGKAET